MSQLRALFITKEQTCHSLVTFNRSQSLSSVLTAGDLGTAPWLCSFVGSSTYGGALKNWVQLESAKGHEFSLFFPRLAKSFSRVQKTVWFLVARITSTLYIRNTFTSFIKFSTAAVRAPWWSLLRKEPPSSWVCGSCTSPLCAGDSYLCISHAIKMPMNTFCIFWSFLLLS